MASGLTHILLTRKLQDYLPDGDLKNILRMQAILYKWVRWLQIFRIPV